MRTYPIELRQRIVDAVDHQRGTIAEIAEMFGVKERYVYKLLAQRRELGTIAPLPHGGGAQAKLSEEHLMKLTELVAEHPDARLDDLCQMLSKQVRVKVSRATIWRALVTLDLTLKKRRNEPRRQTGKSGPRSSKNNPRSRPND